MCPRCTLKKFKEKYSSDFLEGETLGIQLHVFIIFLMSVHEVKLEEDTNA